MESILPNELMPNYRKILIQIAEKSFFDYFCGNKMILTATGEYAYRRPNDGIYVVPIGCLKQ